MSFDASSTTSEVLDGVDLRGRTVLVTGASTGLGLETARSLATTGAHVIATVRDRTKAQAVVDHIEKASPGATVEVVLLDLASLRSVRACAASVRERHAKLDLLINNAGVMAPPFGRTADGFELQLGTNYLGHFLLTCLLAPSLVAAAPARVVCLSSYAHVQSDFGWHDPHYRTRPYDAMEAYGQSKTAMILFTVELERRLGPHGVHAYAVHPGVIATDLSRHLAEDFATSAARMPDLLKLKTVEAGAATTVWAATAPELDDVGGVYLEDCHISDEVAPSAGLVRGRAPYAIEPERAKRLWAWSERQVGESWGDLVDVG